MRFLLCGCRAADYERIPRRWWMRPLLKRRLFHCPHCDARMLVSDQAVMRRRLDQAQAQGLPQQSLA